MVDQTAAEQPAWLAGVQQPAPVQHQPVAEAPAEVKNHAFWFAWARQFEQDINRCHIAAHAAAAAMARGEDSAAAARAAQQAATGTAPGAPTGVPPYTLSYSAFYAWAANELHLDADRAHRVAHTATHAMQRGVVARDAANLGLQAVGLQRAATSDTLPWTSDPAVRSTIIGAVCILALLFLPFYFVVLPVLGLLYALRSLGSPRLYFAMAGLGLNGLAVVLAGLNLFGIL